ncbi:MAG TPA: hypothetical protein DCQ31_10050 [Bacteroidales bacterium]|nr:hypothetical protein [Bacteroidales bacterium]
MSDSELFDKKEENQISNNHSKVDKYEQFFTISTNGMFQISLSTPIDITLPAHQQISLVLRNAYISDCNPAFATMFGRQSAQELISKSVRQIFRSKFDTFNYTSLNTFVHNNYSIRNIETIFTDATGKTVFFLSSVSGIVLNGCLVEAFGTLTDITLIRNSQHELIRKTNLLEVMSENVPNFNFYIINRAMLIEQASGSELANIDKEALRGMSLSRVYKGLELHINTIITDGFHKIRRSFDLWNEDMYLKFSGIPIIIKGTVEYVLVMVNNKTDEKQKEHELEKSKNRFELALQAGNLGVFEYDIVNKLATVSDEYARMLGYEPHEYDASEDSWYNAIHPDDRARVLQSLEDYINGRTRKYTIEFKIQHAEGYYIWVLSNGKIVSYSPSGKPLLMFGTHTDITELKNR